MCGLKGCLSGLYFTLIEMDIELKDQILDDWMIGETVFLKSKHAHEVYLNLKGEINPRLFDFLLMSKWIEMVRNN